LDLVMHGVLSHRDPIEDIGDLKDINDTEDIERRGSLATHDV